jgi:uncharacterized membrane protein YdfJ with MMPL/SSD domain
VPATMKLLGDANWWLPRRLERALPKIDIGHANLGTTSIYLQGIDPEESSPRSACAGRR